MKEMADLFDAMAESGELADQSALQVVDQLISCQLIGNGNRTADRYKKAAKLFFPSADFNNLLYLPQRHLNIPLIDQLKTCEFIDSELNIMIQSATGGGKTFLACAYGNEACEHGYTVRYFIMPDLMSTYHNQESKGKGEKFLRKLVNTNLVIIDDFMLTRITSEDADFLYRLISSKPRSSIHRSFLICSQLMPEEMYNRLSQAGGAIADTIMNRLTAKAYTITLEGDSMRNIDIAAALAQQQASRSNTQ